MRKFSILSLGLLALTVAGTAIAGPTGFVVQVPGELRVSQSKPVESAQKVIRKSAGLPDAVELVLARDRTSSGLRMMRFSQVHKGIPVYKRGVALAFDSHGVTRIASSKVEHVLPDSVVPVLDANAAAEVATKTAGLAATASNTRLLIWPTASGGRLAYSVLPPNLLPIPYAPVVIVDAETGDVLSVQNLVRQKNMANMFEVSPREPNSSLPRIQVELPVGEGLDVPDNDLLKSFNCVDKKTTRDVSIMGFNLKIHLCELEKSAVADTVNGDFLQYDYENDTEGGDAFAQVSIFYHSSRAYKFFKGFDPGFELEATSKPLFLVANLMLPDGLMEFDPTRFANPDLPLIPFDNAFSMAGDPQMGAMMSTIWPEITGGALMFGQGYNVDFSYDGSVIYHEFAHSMVGSTIGLVGSWHLDSQGGTCSPGAMNEALADYYAGAISGDDIVGEYAGKGLGLETIRDLKNTKTCPANLTGEVHADSEFFSAPMWATRTALASDDDRFAFDKAIFEALGNASSGDVAFEELAELLVTAVGVPLGEATSNLLRDKFEERGVLPVCQRTWTYTGKPINSNDPNMRVVQGGSPAFQMPGKGSFTGLPSSLPAPGTIQVEVPIDGNPDLLTITFSTYSRSGGGGIPGIGGGGSATPAVVVSFDAPISFDWKAKTTNGEVVATTGSGSTIVKQTATIDVPSGASKAYVMVANSGSGEGFFWGLDFATGNAPGGEPSEQDGGPDTGTDAPPDVDEESGDDDSSGCGCRLTDTGSNAATSTSWLAALVALAGAAFLRRRED